MASIFFRYFEEKKLIKFPMGLSDHFFSVKAHIHRMSPLPSVKQGYLMLVHGEIKKEIPVPVVLFLFGDATLNVSMNRSLQPKKQNVICNYWKKPGRTKDKCYKLDGYPSDFKFLKSKKISIAAYGESVQNQLHNGSI